MPGSEGACANSNAIAAAADSPGLCCVLPPAWAAVPSTCMALESAIRVLSPCVLNRGLTSLRMLSGTLAGGGIIGYWYCWSPSDAAGRPGRPAGGPCSRGEAPPVVLGGVIAP